MTKTFVSCDKKNGQWFFIDAADGRVVSVSAQYLAQIVAMVYGLIHGGIGTLQFWSFIRLH
jgi:hypothetical protein